MRRWSRRNWRRRGSRRRSRSRSRRSRRSRSRSRKRRTRRTTRKTTTPRSPRDSLQGHWLRVSRSTDYGLLTTDSFSHRHIHSRTLFADTIPVRRLPRLLWAATIACWVVLAVLTHIPLDRYIPEEQKQ